MKKKLFILSIMLVSMILLPLLFLSYVPPVEAQSLAGDCGVIQPPLGTPFQKGLQHLEEVMDKYHTCFDVYTDAGAGGNHFNHPAMMGCGVSSDGAFTETVYLGATAIKNTFVPGCGANWGGFVFQVGILGANDTTPKDNWGTYPDAGHDLSGATKITFWAKGLNGGEQVEFFAFGLGRNQWGQPTEAYPDSSPKVTLCGLSGSNPCFMTLTNIWQQYTIDLTNVNLSYVIGGFAWVTNAAKNNNQSITFYLDDIQYHKSSLTDPRFLQSFETLPTHEAFDLTNTCASFIYDDALTLIAFTAAGNHERSTLLADAFLHDLGHDRYYDGSLYNNNILRNAYCSGDLMVAPGWTPNNRLDTGRVAGWWENNQWNESREYVGLGTGNMAWVMIALLNFYEKWGGEKYLAATQTLAEWVETHTRDERGAGGYMGGFVGWEPTPDFLSYKSTEHNLDLYVVFERLFQITGQQKWHDRALHARTFVEAMWNDADGYYWTGVYPDGITINEQAIPLDGQTWACLAFGDTERIRRAIAYAEVHHYATYGDYEGFDFNEDQEGPWPEGVGQMVTCYWLLKETNKAQKYLDELRDIQTTASNNNGKGIVSALDPLTPLDTGFDWKYYNRLHIGATAWFVMAEIKNFNPYWPSASKVYLPLILKVTPNHIDVYPGEILPLDLSIEDAKNLYGLQSTCSVDPAILTPQSNDLGDFFSTPLVGINAVDGPVGTAQIALSQQNPADPLAGDGLFARMKVQAVAPGTSAVTCDPLFSDRDGFELAGSSLAGQVTVLDFGNISGTVSYQGQLTHADIQIEASGPINSLGATDNSGAYEIGQLKAGSYDIRADAPRYLPSCTTAALNNSDILALINTILKGGDTNDDEMINIADATLVGANFGQDTSSTDSRADINADGKVNVQDLAILGGNFSLNGCQVW